MSSEVLDARDKLVEKKYTNTQKVYKNIHNPFLQGACSTVGDERETLIE